MFTNFPTPKSFNLSGLRSFKFLHRSAIDTWPGVFNSKIIVPVTLNSGFTWLNGYSTPLTLLFTEEVKTTSDGKFYEQQIIGFAPGDREDLIDLMEQMDNRDFVIQIKDTRNQTRLVGAYGYPLTFSSSYNSGLGRDEAKGYNFKFTGVSLIRAPVYL